MLRRLLCRGRQSCLRCFDTQHLVGASGGCCLSTALDAAIIRGRRLAAVAASQSFNKLLQGLVARAKEHSAVVLRLLIAVRVAVVLFFILLSLERLSELTRDLCST